MRIAVFLDVDKTLTEGFIQEEYAKALKCKDAYSALEEQYQRKAILSGTFGDKIADLFAGKDFTQVEANGHYDDVKLKPDAKELLEQQMQPGMVKADIYLVSSGPNYYIDALAARYKIDEKNVCRSVYKFNHGTGLIESCSIGITDQDKADFVSKKKEEGKYDITIGVGDNAGLDGAFLSQCTIRLMTEQTGTYLHIPKLTSLPPLIERLSKISHAEISDERLVALVKEKCAQSPKLVQDLRGLYPSGSIDDDGVLAIIKAKGKQNPKLVQDLQRLYPPEPVGDEDLLAMFKERCEDNPILTQGLPKTNAVLPAALLLLTLLVVVLSALGLASLLTPAVPAIVASILLAAGGVLLIYYWTSSRRGIAFWCVMAPIYVLQMGLAAAILRDVFYDSPHQWVSPEVRWALIPAILAFLAAPAIADPARDLIRKRRLERAREETT